MKMVKTFLAEFTVHIVRCSVILGYLSVLYYGLLFPVHQGGPLYI